MLTGHKNDIIQLIWYFVRKPFGMEIILIKLLIVGAEADLSHRIGEEARGYGYRVFEAESTEEAMKLYETKGPDVLILHMAAARCSSRGILLRIRSTDPAVPIITIGKTEEEAEQIQAMDMGADDAVPASVSEKMLLKRVESLLRRSGRLDAEEFQVGDLRLSTETYQAFWQGQPLNLTAKEFDLLKTLMKNKGRILPRLLLLDRVWGYDYTGGERVVDAHIKNLRHKIPEPVIKTVKGIGYAIEN